MNEQVARGVLLIRSIEMTDTARAILSDDDRMYASRSARELAQWQAADSGSAVTAEHFLQQRAELLHKRIGERHPLFAALFQRRSGWHALSWVLPLAALILGAGLDRLGDPHRLDLLSAPLLGIVGWNLAVYLMLIPLSRARWQAPSWISGIGKTLPRKLPQALASGVADFMLQWTDMAAGLNRARFGRMLHLSAAAFALGAVLSLYARGLMTAYQAGWESTFLNAAQVHAILSVVFAPATWVLGIPGFSLADIESLHFGAGQSGPGGARWVHLYAATLFLLVIVPRGVLAALAHWQARRQQRAFPLDLGHPYFRALTGQVGAAGPALLRVLPYSFTLDEARDQGLGRLAAMLLGEQARVMLRPSSSYGEEPAALLREVNLDDADVAVTAVLFNLAATPERENHGVFLDHLVRHCTRGIAVLIDESSLLERSGAERVAERMALWQQFCRFHRAPPTFVNLLQPDLRPPSRDGLTLSKAP